MERSRNIMRRSIFTFLQNYNHFTSKAALLAFPFSASILLSQALFFNPYSSFSSSSLSRFSPAIHLRLNALFTAAGFPISSEFFAVLTLKLSQTIASSILALPFTLSFFLVSKAYVIQFITTPKTESPPTISSVFSLYIPLLKTYICNILFVLAANSTVFAILLFACNALQGLFSFGSDDQFLIFLSAFGAIFYSIVLANALVISNLALVLSGVEKSGGYLAILKACVLIKGRASTALSLALPLNIGLASIEALFQYRVVRAYHRHEKGGSSVFFEGVFIAQLYSVLLVLDTIVNTLFLKTCQEQSFNEDHEDDDFSCSSYSKKLNSMEELA